MEYTEGPRVMCNLRPGRSCMKFVLVGSNPTYANFEIFLLQEAVYYTVKVHNFDLKEKTIENNNNTITAK